MMVAQSFNDASSYVSAPTSTPSRCNSLNSMYYYYSAPASPSRVIIDASFDFESEPTLREDVTSSSNLDDFEFETSRKFYHLDDFEFEKSPNFEEYSTTKTQIFEYSAVVEDELDYQEGRHRGESLIPSMAFADELFRDGRVVPAPLKLPPRLRADHDNKENKSGHCSSTASSPRSPSSVLNKLYSFPPRRSLWNDDFDPFTTALENVVREEKKRGRSHENNCRRARSQSPLRNILPLWSIESKKNTQPLEPLLLNEEPIHQTNDGSAWVPNQTEQMGPQNSSSQQVGLSSYELAKPKGLGIARKLRPLNLGHERPILKTGEREIQETKKQGIRGLLFRNASMDRECSEHNKQGGEDQSLITVWKPQKMKSFSFKSLGEAHSNGKKRVAREMKSFIHYRPKLFLCMNFGFKAPRK